MLIALLLAFGLMGIASRYFAGSRTAVILLLSVGSIACYSPATLLVIIFLALANYLFIRSSQKKAALVGSVIFNILFLAAFHFYILLEKQFPQGHFPIILGVSFLILQFIDYGYKVYYKQFLPPADLLLYLSSVFYLPKFFSGPIASLPDVANQVKFPVKKSVSYGLNRILLGLFKKLVLAESLAPMVHSVFDFGDAYPGFTFLTAACLYSFQLYFDFSGYSDMAVGVSALWGIELPENFNFPFRQKSWAQFWKSWHSSLTGWLWQYIFNSLYLSFSRKKTSKSLSTFICALLVFAGMAFFNGIQTGFYLSAGIFAFSYFIEQSFKIKSGAPNQFLVFIIFSIALIYFRSPDHAVYCSVTHNLFGSNFIPPNWRADFLAPLASGGSQQDYFNLLVGLTLSLVFLAWERKLFALFSQEKINFVAWFVACLVIFVWGVFESGERFIYMQF